MKIIDVWRFALALLLLTILDIAANYFFRLPRNDTANAVLAMGIVVIQAIREYDYD